jgi:hypothetical protein
MGSNKKSRGIAKNKDLVIFQRLTIIGAIEREPWLDEEY